MPTEFEIVPGRAGHIFIFFLSAEAVADYVFCRLGGEEDYGRCGLE